MAASVGSNFVGHPQRMIPNRCLSVRVASAPLVILEGKKISLRLGLKAGAEDGTQPRVRQRQRWGQIDRGRRRRARAEESSDKASTAT